MLIELFEAIEKHDIERVRMLLKEGSDPNKPKEQPPRWRPLQAAIEELEFDGSIEIVNLLIKHGADVNAWDYKHALTPLLCAIFSMDMRAIRLLLEADADPNVESDEGVSPLRWAVQQGNIEMAALLLHYGADKTINDFGGFCGYTALDIAARRLDIPMIKILINANANPEALNEDYEKAYQCLPPRDDCDTQVWDEAMELLTRNKMPSSETT